MKLFSFIIVLCLVIFGCSRKHTEHLEKSSTVVGDSLLSRSNCFDLTDETVVFVSTSVLPHLRCDSAGGISLCDTFSMVKTRPTVYGSAVPVYVKRRVVRSSSRDSLSSFTSADYKSSDVHEVYGKQSLNIWKYLFLFLFVYIIGLFVYFVWRSK